MSKGTTPPGATTHATGVAIERPARIQELRDAAGTDEQPSASATSVALDERVESDLDPGRASSAPATGGASARVRVDGPSTAAAERSRRTALVVALVIVGVVALAGGFVAFGRSSTPARVAAAPSTAEIAPTGAALAPESVAAAQRTVEMCEAAETYSIDDLLLLGRNISSEPDALLAAYETLLVNSPPDLRPLIDQMGPLTRKAVSEVKRGLLTSDTAVQLWLASAPPAELEAWVSPQQELAPRINALCATV